MQAEVINANLPKISVQFLLGATLIELDFKYTTEGEPIESEELYVVTPFGVWKVE